MVKCCFAILCQCTSLIPKTSSPLSVCKYRSRGCNQEDIYCHVCGGRCTWGEVTDHNISPLWHPEHKHYLCCLVNILVSNPWTEISRKGFKSFDGHVSHVLFLCLFEMTFCNTRQISWK